MEILAFAKRLGIVAFFIFAHHVRDNVAQRFPNSSIDASYPGLSSGCATAVDPLLSCDDVLADSSLSFVYLTDERLDKLCTETCAASLNSAQKNIVNACKASSDFISDGETRYPATYVLDRFIWSFNATCRKDKTSGAYCHSYLRDLATGNSINVTDEAKCSDCMLGVTQIELSSPFAYDNTSVAEFSSSASACGKPTYTIKEPTPYILPNPTTTTSATPLPSNDCSEQYNVADGDTCHSIAQAHNVSTFGLLYWNSLAVGCTDFPKTGSKICLPSPCPIYKVQENDTYFGIVSQHAPERSMRQLRSWNLNINSICSNLNDMVGYQICIGPPASIAGAEPPSGVTGSPTSTPVATLMPVPTNAASGSNTNCGLWYTTISGDLCGTISGQYGISLKDFYFLNPSINSTDCHDLQVKVAYCVKPVGDITTYPGYDGGGGSTTGACDGAFPASTCYLDPSTLPSLPFLEPNATFPALPDAPTTTPTRTSYVPAPTAPGSQAGCASYVEYIQTGNTADDELVNSCANVARYFEISLDQFLTWNPSLSSTNCMIKPGFAYCGYMSGADGSTTLPGVTSSPTATPSATPSTSPSPTGTPQPPGPVQDGIAKNCNKYALQKEGVFCWDMANANGISLDQLYEWNPALNGDCSGMWPNYAYCVGVST